MLFLCSSLRPKSSQPPSPSSHSGTEPLQSTQMGPSAHSLRRVGVRLAFLPCSWLFRLILRDGIRLNLSETELLLSVGCHSDVLCLVGHGAGAILGDGLQKTQKDERSRAEASRARQLLPSRFIPREF